ncbi:hypothetical protein GH714_010458 [Hevea brasiliensis]|uniref:Bet v I/Major latex protein domain-containing protein n=1 Tax=Hevea brasiliensis TaxID=3981 RepID=A0A6A6K3W0_HEVBR|nr:hypothetical protein GH714_010458 [Hevea brasiliensis]
MTGALQSIHVCRYMNQLPHLAERSEEIYKIIINDLEMTLTKALTMESQMLTGEESDKMNIKRSRGDLDEIIDIQPTNTLTPFNIESLGFDLDPLGIVHPKAEMTFVTANCGVKVLIKSQPDAFWSKVQESKNSFPAAAPDIYKSITDDARTPGKREVEYGSAVLNFKKSIEQITENSQENFTYKVDEGDIPRQYNFNGFRAAILYPNDKWVEWTWSYNYDQAKKDLALRFDALFAKIAVETLAKLDNHIQKP